jgi:hypothetical protein
LVELAQDAKAARGGRVRRLIKTAANYLVRKGKRKGV